MKFKKLLLLEAKGKFVDDNEVIVDFVGAAINTFEVITGEEITDAQHVRQIIGELVSAGKIDFRSVGAVTVCASLNWWGSSIEDSRFFVSKRIRN